MKPFWSVFADWRWWLSSVLGGLAIIGLFGAGWKAHEIFEQRGILTEQLSEERMENNRLAEQIDALSDRLDNLTQRLQPILPPPPPLPLPTSPTSSSGTPGQPQVSAPKAMSRA